MRITKLLTPLAFTAALALAATPAHAQQRSGSRRGSEQGGGQARSGGQQRGAGAQAPVSRGQAAPRAQAYRGGVTSGPYTVVRNSTRYYGGVGGYGGTHYGYAPHVLDRHAFIVGGPRFYSPYYTFHTHFSLGFGISVGYPVAYPFYATPYVYGSPYPYANAYPYPGTYPSDPYYGTTAPYTASPNDTTTYGPSNNTSGEQPGGLSFTMSPVNAAVFVDGVYVGAANEFGPESQPLGLVPGRHHVELRANGYQTMSFDADVVAGQVTPYQATMHR